MAEIKHITDENYADFLIKGERPLVIDFWAAWCGPCKMVAPEIEKLAAKYDGVLDVAKVDVDANPGISQAFAVMSIPTIALVEPGEQPKLLQRIAGFRPLPQLEKDLGLDRISAPAS